MRGILRSKRSYGRVRVESDYSRYLTDTNVIRPAMTFDKISIRCRSRSLVAINPIRISQTSFRPGSVTF